MARRTEFRTPPATRARARLRDRLPLVNGMTCEMCQHPRTDDRLLVRHHRDGDPFNGDPTNIGILCQPCHVQVHRRWRQAAKATGAALEAPQQPRQRAHGQRSSNAMADDVLASTATVGDSRRGETKASKSRDNGEGFPVLR